MNRLNEIKKELNLKISDELLLSLLFEMGRYFDKELADIYRTIQKKNNKVLDYPARKRIRKKYYYGPFYTLNEEYDISQIEYTNVDIENICTDCLDRLYKYDKEKIINSMKQRINNLKDNVTTDNNMVSWLKAYNKRRKNKLYSLCCFYLDQKKFKKSKYNENVITEFIKKTYNDLENYRYLAIVVKDEIFNQNGECITWKLLYKAGVYAENFVQFKNKFYPFKKEEQIRVLSTFLEERNIENCEELASNYYSTISTGYKFEDCYISDNQDCKILIYKKIELDESPVPCPSCNTTIQRGNSYPEVFLRSYECSNPNCPDRSKSGRGKRFDEYGTYRYFKLVENAKQNRISEKDYQNWRRDIFDHKLDWLDAILKKYVFAGEKAYITDQEERIISGRKIINLSCKKLSQIENVADSFNDLPIVRLFKEINTRININSGNRVLENNIEIIQGSSVDILQELAPNQIGTAITSPPYYNAREYSQWPNMIMYYVDMLINSKAVYGSMSNDGYYLYNIGDIVCEDNIYVVSNMSKKRCQLGFLSCLIFEIVGFNLTGNIIWDKGEVQSKRNSTINLFTGYVKCINCYEHVFVFRKGSFEKVSNSVNKITPVIKINSKGENTYKHTAPYPVDLVELVRPYVINGLYILDPFLGSGTTLRWCVINGYLGVGIELNEEYYNLCIEKVFNNNIEPLF